jgi:hypothetical protein
MNKQPETRNSENETNILTAVQLGWLVVETFGRLRRYERSKRKPRRRAGEQTRRFAFSNNELTSLDELLWSINQLHHRVTKLSLDLPPAPLPPGQELEQQLDNDELDLDALHEELDEWSKQVWGLLNVEDGVMGRAFSYGGSLADTYWHAAMDWSDEKSVARLLSRYRLGYIATQSDRIAVALPPYIAPALQYSLRKWSDVNLDLVEKDRLESRLKAQQEVWRDLLFGRRSAESYLRVTDYRVIAFFSNGVRIGLILIIVIAVGVAGWGLGSIFPSGEDTGNLSGFFAAVSSFVVVMGGLVTRFSSWVRSSGDFVRERLKLRLILVRTYRDWQSK